MLTGPQKKVFYLGGAYPCMVDPWSNILMLVDELRPGKLRVTGYAGTVDDVVNLPSWAEKEISVR